MRTTTVQRRSLMLGALGVVYGDIGTSPLYALRECFNGPHGTQPNPQNVIGVVSLIIWTLVLVVCVKYLTLVMRADNRGEGGILSLLSLASRDRKGREVQPTTLLLLAVFGAALLYGDGMLTPAITVLGAVEGLEIATPIFKPYVVVLAILILVGLFSFQKHGTGRMGAVFGPIMVLWFVTLGALGIHGIARAPQILGALNPLEALRFFAQHGTSAFPLMGAVFLAVTGSETLYADMGHCGASAIRRAWYLLVVPALALNYMGGGGLLLMDPAAARNPFYLLAPSWMLFPLVGLATAAAVIASQALIAGAYSLSMQAVQMNLLPRLRILHTSHAARGQVYMPQVNTALMVACIAVVITFRSSSALAGAYGIAVSLTMLMTTVLFYSASRRLWGWPQWLALLVCAAFACVELVFVGSNGLKFFQGGWVPLVVAVSLFTLMLTWRRGRQMLRDRLSASYLPFDIFLADMDANPPHRVPGTAVFLSGNPGGTPVALLHNLRHNKVLHARVVVLTILTADYPTVSKEDRLTVEKLRPDVFRVVGRFGFMEQPDVPHLLDRCVEHGLEFSQEQTSFFVSRETIIPRKGPGMIGWRRKLFAAMSRNAQPVTAFFKLTPNRVVELGMQVEV